MTEAQINELKEISGKLFNFFYENELTFKERSALSNACGVLYSFTDNEGRGLHDYGCNILHLDDFSFTEEQLNWTVPKHFPRGDWDRLPWEQPIPSKDDQRQRVISQNDANLTKAYLDTFSRPSIAKYL